MLLKQRDWGGRAQHRLLGEPGIAQPALTEGVDCDIYSLQIIVVACLLVVAQQPYSILDIAEALLAKFTSQIRLRKREMRPRKRLTEAPQSSIDSHLQFLWRERQRVCEPM